MLLKDFESGEEQEKTLKRILEMYWNIFTGTEICYKTDLGLKLSKDLSAEASQSLVTGT